MSAPTALQPAQLQASLHDLARKFGGDVRGDYIAIPTPGHSKRDRGTIIRLRADGCGFVSYSFNGFDDWRALHAALGLQTEARQMTATERREFAKAREHDRAAREKGQLVRMSALWSDGYAAEPGGVVRIYWEARGIPAAIAAMAIAQRDIREHRDDAGRFSMLTLARDLDGNPRAVQMTKLRSDGSGKRGTPPRITFGPLMGSAARLFRSDGETLAICEGTETALGFFALRKIPAWSTFGTANLAAFSPPRGIRRLYIAADGDEAGREAGERLFHRLKGKLRCILAPAPDGLDWLDVWEGSQ